MKQEENKEESKDLIVQASAIKIIKDAETYTAAARLRGEIRFAADYHANRLDPLIRESDQHTRNLRKERATHIDPLQAVYKYLGELLTDYTTDQDRIRQERQKIADRLEDAIVIVSETPIVEDLSFASHKHYEVVDLMALVKAVAAGQAPLRVLWDISKPFRSAYLNSQAVALHDTIKPDDKGIRWLYPGVKCYSTQTAVTKSA